MGEKLDRTSGPNVSEYVLILLPAAVLSFFMGRLVLAYYDRLIWWAVFLTALLSSFVLLGVVLTCRRRRETGGAQGMLSVRAAFLTVMSGCLALFIAELFMSHGESITTFVFITGGGKFSDTFMDHFNSVMMTSDAQPYDNTFGQAGGMYPPFAYMLYRLLYLITPVWAAADGYEMRGSMPGIIIFVALFALGCAALFSIVRSLWKGSRISAVLFGVLMLLSAPFLFLIERGNVIFASIVLSAFFLVYKDSDKKWVRELSFLCLAAAAAIKMYPALFGLLLIRDKRWSEAIRCVIYGVLFFALPCFCFGGPEAFIKMLRNAFHGFGEIDSGIKYRVDAANTIQYFLQWLFGIFKLPYGTAVFSRISTAFLYPLGVLSAFVLKKGWKPAATLSLIFILAVKVSYIYTLPFLIIPLVLFLNGEDKPNVFDWIYTALFVCICAPVKFFAIYMVGDLSLAGLLSRGAALLMLALLCVEGIIATVAMLKKHRQAKIAAVGSAD